MQLEEILVDAKSAHRKGAVHSVSQEARLFHRIAATVFKPRDQFLREITNGIQTICKASSAGISLLTKDEGGNKVLQWEGLTGSFLEMNGQRMAYPGTPCGDSIERKQPLLLHYPSRHYQNFEEIKPKIVDLLIIPMFYKSKALGTLWVMSQNPSVLFSDADLALMRRVSRFVAFAIYLDNLHQTALEQKDRFQSLSESSPLGIFVADKNGICHYSNPRCDDLISRTADCDITRPWHCILPTEVRAKAGENWTKHVRAGKEYKDTFLIPSHQKQDRWISVRGVPLAGTQPLFLGTVEDITRRKAEETALYRSEEFTRNILKTSPDCIKVLDAAGRLIFMNEIGVQTLGIKNFNKVRNARWVNFWSANIRRLAVAAMKEARAGREGRFQGPRKTMTGIAKWWDVSVSQLPAPDGSIQFLVISRDITQLKIQEQELCIAQEQLRKYADALEQKVQARTRELQDANQNLRILTRKMAEAHETERKHIARELHDAFAQQLTGLKLILERECHQLQPEQAKGFNDAKELVTSMMVQVRELSFDLRQSLPDHISLEAALELQFRKMDANYGLKVKAKKLKNSDSKMLPRELKIAILRIVQEALTNVVRHGGTNQAEVRINTQKNWLKLEVMDKGNGFDGAKLNGRSTGLSGMRERALLLGGAFNIRSRKGFGTQLEVEFPIENKV